MTASNKVRIIKMSNKIIEKSKLTRKTFYIEADEKWILWLIPADMVKLVLIHEGYNKGLSNKKRKILLNKHYIGYQR